MRTPRPKRRVVYFFLEGDLHKVLSANRSTNLVYAWSFPKNKRVMYIYSDMRKRMGKAYTLTEVSKIVGRTRVTIYRYMQDGKIRWPQRGSFSSTATKHGTYYLCDQDIYDLHDYLLTVHRGAPRKDGMIVPRGTPSRMELKAMLEHETALYVKDKDGEFIQVWKEAEW